LNDIELKEIVEKFGLPRVLKVLQLRQAIDDFVTQHKDDGMAKLVGPKDIEISLAYGMAVEQLMDLEIPVRKSLEESYDEANASLKQRELLSQILSQAKGIGSSTSKNSVKKDAK
jgi:hypothetical protein